MKPKFLEIPFQRIKLEPGEQIVLNHPGVLEEAARANIRKSCVEIFGIRRVVILEEGMTIAAVKVKKMNRRCKA